jgi:hypothetical protein
MKSAFVLMLALSAVNALGAPNDEYSTSVHVKKSYLTKDGDGLYQRLDAVIDGRSYELASLPVTSPILSGAILLPGDYRAKIVKDEHKVPYKMLLVYEFKFPDGKTDRFNVIGMTE